MLSSDWISSVFFFNRVGGMTTNIMRYFISFLFLYLLIGYTNAQEKKVMNSIINTSAECNSCKVRLEEKLNHISGIRFAELNLENKDIIVSYNSKKINHWKVGLDKIESIKY